MSERYVITGDDPERAFGEVRSVLPNTDWASPDHHSRVRAFRERYDGDALYYLEAIEFLDGSETEYGFPARIDLDADGWRGLRDLCDAVLADMESDS